MTDIVERLHPGVFSVPTHLARAMAEGVDEIKRLRAERDRLAAEVSRAHKDALTWMERAAAANAEIERLRAEVARCEASLLAWIEAVGECNKDRNRLREALEKIAGITMSMCLSVDDLAQRQKDIAREALAAKEPGHE